MRGYLTSIPSGLKVPIYLIPKGLNLNNSGCNPENDNEKLVTLKGLNF